ncbi:MAG: SMC-Scp complex subunit ScpB [Clostridia bacterium]|nr:SMC-Scp complex subunit ScpB [Clostridia bacterium]
MTFKELRAAAEAVLFASGEPVEAEKIAEALEISVEDVEKLVASIIDELNSRNSGICVIKLDDKYQMCTRLECAKYVRNALEIKKNTPLSQAAFEVLAIVAYNQPVTKSFIEQVRGVDCSGPIANLVQKSLIEEKGRLDLPGRPLLYGTTDGFLRCFCISSLSELPPLPEKETDVETPVKLNDEENKEETAE